jgi:sec-independent protein translocase protein TatA
VRTIGPMELVIILAIAILIFGGRKIPELAKGLGEGIRNFKTSLKGEEKPQETKEEKKQA